MKAARIIGDIVLLLTWQVDGVSITPNFPAPISAMRCDLEASSRTYHRIRVPQVCELFNAANAVDAHEIHGDGRWPGSCASAHGKFDDLGMAEEEAADFVEIVADSSDGTGRPAGAAAPRDAVLLELHEWIGLIALDARVVLEALPFSPFVVNGNLPDNLLFEQPKGEVEVRSYMGMVSVDVVRRKPQAKRQNREGERKKSSGKKKLAFDFFTLFFFRRLLGGKKEQSASSLSLFVFFSQDA